MSSCNDSKPLTLTQKVLSAVVDRLSTGVCNMHAEFFPDRPNSYILNHPQGAFLVSYAKSKFSAPLDTGVVVQHRDLHFTVTSICRSLNSPDGVVAMLDVLRQCLVGFTPPNCRRRVYVVSEDFLGQNNGLWSYQTIFGTELQQIQHEIMP